ncbi:MAG TPA: PAS domain-containing protein [Thermoanaerobaculia bacterium]
MTIGRTMLRPRVEPMRPDRPLRPPDAATGLQDFIAGLATEFGAAPIERIDATITDALGRIGTLAGVDRAYVYAVRGDRLMNTNVWCRGGTDPQIVLEVSTSMYRWCTARLLAGHMLYVPRVRDLPDDEVDKSILARQAVQSVLAVPIVLRGRVIAFVGFDTVRRERHWTADTIALLKIASAIFGSAMTRRDAEQALLDEKEFFGNVVQTLGSLVLVLAPDGQCLRVNRAFSDLTGLSAEELSGTGWQSVIPQDARDVARRALRNTLAGVRTQFEGPLVSYNGERRTILWNGSVVRKPERATGYVVITGIDLTETLRLRTSSSRRAASTPSAASPRRSCTSSTTCSWPSARRRWRCAATRNGSRTCSAARSTSRTPSSAVPPSPAA